MITGITVMKYFTYLFLYQCKDTVQVPVMFGVYGWNRRNNPNDYDGIYCCESWKEVVELLINKNINYND